MKSIFITRKSTLLEMKLCAPGSFNACTPPSLCYLLLSVQAGAVIFMMSQKYNTDLKFYLLTRHTQETEFLNGAQFCPCSRFNMPHPQF